MLYAASIAFTGVKPSTLTTCSNNVVLCFLTNLVSPAIASIDLTVLSNIGRKTSSSPPIDSILPL
ncbi:hypothetical protein LINGRAHAP2_LOCUS4799 [Linum grandiflorum]